MLDMQNEWALSITVLQICSKLYASTERSGVFRHLVISSAPSFSHESLTQMIINAGMITNKHIIEIRETFP